MNNNNKTTTDFLPLLSQGAVPLKRDVQVKFALRVQRCCTAVFTDVS